MARVQYGSIVTELKGKVAGQVFQGGNVGFVLRNKGYTPGISSTKRQAANRNLVANTSTWRDLSDSDRAAWAAGAPNWLFTDKFGNTYVGSGFQMHNAYNSILLSLGLPTVSVPGVVAAPNDPGTAVIVCKSNGYSSVTWDNPGGTDDYIAVFASASQSAGRNINNVRFKRLYYLHIDGDDAINDYLSYIAAWGLPQLGSTVVFKVVYYNSTFPYGYYTQIVSTVVVAP